MKKLFIAIIFSAFISIASFGQTGELKGMVYDSKSNKPILGASIGIYSQDKFLVATVTDKRGNFFYSPMNPGKYKITAKADGYNEQTKNSVVIKADKISFVDFYLEKPSSK